MKIASFLIWLAIVGSKTAPAGEMAALLSTDAHSTLNQTAHQPVVVAFGDLKEHKHYEQRPNFPIPPEGTLDLAIYEIRSIRHGTINSPKAVIAFSPVTLRGPLPQQAILIMTHCDSSESSFEPIGREAWRGILLDTPEARERTEATSLAELSGTPPHLQLPEATARQIALDRIIALKDYTRYSNNHKFLYTRREPFGWYFSVAVLVEEARPPYINHLLVQVNDEGNVVSCMVNSFGSIYTAEEWNTIPEASFFYQSN